MEGETSWISHCPDEASRGRDSYSELVEEGGKEVVGSVVSVDLILPDDLLERILAYLPVASKFRAGCVCKRWHEIVSSERFLWNSSQVLSQKPWYFMFTGSSESAGHAYDPTLRKWYGLELPFVRPPNGVIASSRGLVCSIDGEAGAGEVCVCNPITGRRRRLESPPGLCPPDYSALAVSARPPRGYRVSVVKSKQVPGDFFRWEVSVHVYDSAAAAWGTPLSEVLAGWRAGEESVICGGTLYFLVYSTGGGGAGPAPAEGRHGLVGHGLGAGPAAGPLMRSFVAVPCALTCGRLMNLKERLVMVGGIGKADRPDIIKGIGIWVLSGAREWLEVGRMPHKFFQGFGELDDVFASSGVDDVVYIQSYGAPALLMYDIAHNHWRWSQKCPITKRFPLQLFTGFCFEPRLEIAP